MSPPAESTRPPAAHPSRAQALRFWLWLGCMSFGGPAGQIALMHRELVERRRWISEARFAHALNYCMLLPGPEAQQLATYIGWLMHKTWGGIAAGALFVLPSLVLLIALSWSYMTWGHTPGVAALLWGIKPVVAALVVHALLRLARRTWSHAAHALAYAAMSAISFVAIQFFAVPFPLLLLAAAAVGFVLARSPLRADARAAARDDGRQDAEPARTDEAAAREPLMGDHAPAQPHTVFARRRLVAVLGVGLMLWSLPLAALWTVYGWGGTLTQMAWFFTKAALVTFGGAYAVLPYVNQAAVHQFGWVTPAQMMDGLALGESTPGPLIMVVAFVGFVGGWSHPMLGGGAPAGSAVLAACVVTWYTFLPSFVFILGGGPLVESTRHNARLAEPLAAVGAAVLGAIAALAVAFLLHVAWPNGFVDVHRLWQGCDGLAVLLAVGALWLLERRTWPVPGVLVLGAALGVLRAWAA